MLALPLVIGFPTVIDGRPDKIVENLPIIRPTIMGAVPRIFEKVHGASWTWRLSSEASKSVCSRAIDVGLQGVSRTAGGSSCFAPLLAVAQKVADRLVFSTIRDRFGGRVRFFISGSAPLDRDVAQWFDAVGVVLEGYGLTETSAASSLNRRMPIGFGTVGWTLPETECRSPSDSEVLLKGPGVMSGYHDLPDATAEAIDS